LRERRKRHVGGGRQLAHGRGTGAEPAQHGAPRGIAQRAKDPVEMHLLVRHMPNHRASRYLGQCLSEWRRRGASVSPQVLRQVRRVARRDLARTWDPLMKSGRERLFTPARIQLRRPQALALQPAAASRKRAAAFG
jgi:hypothetical protein